VDAVAQDSALSFWVADDYLRAVAVALMDWAWAQIERSDGILETRWLQPAKALQRWVMPEFDMRMAIVDAACIPKT
jgi:hypothetical protein